VIVIVIRLFIRYSNSIRNDTAHGPSPIAPIQGTDSTGWNRFLRSCQFMRVIMLVERALSDASGWPSWQLIPASTCVLWLNGIGCGATTIGSFSSSPLCLSVQKHRAHSQQSEGDSAAGVSQV